ncbi:MAG TPA: DNA processing protein DprA, partial [Streptosporangiaceae bacterium]|nr:DNA processing protein DprA [Streptosporangiaceae bacterium]
CHELIREAGALCVTGARDVIEHVSPVGTDLAGPRLGPAVPRDHLDPALRCLGLLAAAGFVQRCEQGWRARRQT